MLNGKNKRKGLSGFLLVALAVLGLAFTGVGDVSAAENLWIENGSIGIDMYPWGSDNFQYPLGSNNLYSSGGQRYAVKYDGVFKWSKGAGTIPYAPTLSTIEGTHYLVNTSEEIVVANRMGDDVVEVDTIITMLAGTKWVGLEHTIRNVSDNPINLQFYQGDDFDVDHVTSSNDVGKYDYVFRLLMEWDYDGFPYVGVAAVTPPTNFDVAYYDDLWRRILNGNLGNRDYFSGDPAVAFEWEIGNLNPGETATIMKVLAAGATEQDLQAEIDEGIGWFIAIPVDIDIKPGSDPNSINIDSKGVVPVAVLTTGEFDATSVDPETIIFSSAYPVRYTFEDVDGDGDIDLLLHFRTQDLKITENTTTALLLGQTSDGEWIGGADSVKVNVRGGGKAANPTHLKAGLYNVGVTDCDVAAVSGNIIAIAMEESGDNIDYNEDGDMRDKVLGYYDIRIKNLTNTGISIDNNVAIDGDIIAFELRHGNYWQNRTLAYYSIRKGELYDTGIKAYGFGSGTNGPTRAVSNGRIVYTDTAREICIYDTRTQSSYCTGVTGYDSSISGNIVAYNSGSYWGPVSYYDMQTGETYDTGIAGRRPVVDRGIIVFESPEGVGYYDISSGEYVETPLVDGYSASISNGVISAFVDERDWGVDLSGDGDTNDNYMVMAYDIKSGKVISTGIQGCCGTDISNGVIVFDTYEGETDIMTDLNGDGDMRDCVQHYVVLDLKRTDRGHRGR
jgi:hypothetical protein